MKAVGYSRLSKDDADNPGLGNAVQYSRIEACAAIKGLELVEIIADLNVSGGIPIGERPGGARMLEMLRNKEAECVIALRLDRLFRNTADCLTTAEQWDRQGVGLVLVDQNGNTIDVKTAAGKFMLTMYAGASELERNHCRERTRAAMAIRKRDGLRLGTVPYGWQADTRGCQRHAGKRDASQPCRCKLVLDLAEQAVIARIGEMYAGGMATSAIALRLTMTGVPAKRKGAIWHQQSVMNLIKHNNLSRAVRPATSESAASTGGNTCSSTMSA